MKRYSETIAMLGLLAVVLALAVAAVRTGVANHFEAVAFVTGAIWVWLAAYESAWNFPLGLVNAATFCVVFFQSRLFADAGLQVVYLVLLAIGWYLWLYGGENQTELEVTRAGSRELAALAVATCLGTLVLWPILHNYGGSVSFWDALTASISLASQWLLNRKRLETWLGWILVDLIYVPLYIYKDLHLTAILYTVFIAMAVIGWRHWRATWLASQSSASNGMLAEAQPQ